MVCYGGGLTDCSDSHHERQTFRSGGRLGKRAAKRWISFVDALSAIGLRHPGSDLSYLPFDQPNCERHPFSVSSGCHNSPCDCEPVAATELASELDAIFRDHKPGLVRFFQRKVGYDEASDLVQDVFTRAAGSRQRNNLSNPGGFLKRIAQNLLIDRSRKLHRHNVVMLPISEARDAPTAPEQEQQLHAQDLMLAFDRALDTMPVKTRRVFLMQRVDELSYREIQEIVGISKATVEYHMIKALEHLSKELGREI